MNLIILVAVALFQGYHISGIEFPEGIACSFDEGPCHGVAIETLAGTIGITGVPEMGLSSVEPYHMKNMSITVMDHIKVTLKEGDCLGIVKTCKHTKFHMDTVNKIRTVEICCDRIDVVGEYIIESNPEFARCLGDYNGNGNGSLTIEGWCFNFEHNYDMDLGDDGEIYFNPLFGTAKWETSITKASIDVDSIYRGDEDITAEAVCYVNEHWESLFTTFAKQIQSKSMEIYFKAYELFYRLVPARILFKGDLKPLVKKNCDYQ